MLVIRPARYGAYALAAEVDMANNSNESHGEGSSNQQDGVHTASTGRTGPRTPAGKARSKRNALKHGIFANGALLPDESRAEFNSIWRALRETLKPVSSFGKLLVEMMATILWMLRRVPIAEVASIEEARRGYTFRKDDHEPKEKTVRLLVHFEGQENHSALMATTPPDALPPRERCVYLLRDLATGIQSSGFDSNRDTRILTKLYGSLNSSGQKGILIDSYQTWQSAANRSQEERLQKGSASPQECVDHFVRDVEGEIQRLESEKLVDVDRVQLRRLRQIVPDPQFSDHQLRRMTSLQRAFDRLLAQFIRCERIYSGQIPPSIDVHHSLSHD